MAAIALSDSEFKCIGEIMFESVGLAFKESKKSLIQSRLVPRIMKLGLDGFADYIDLLDDESEAAELLTTVCRCADVAPGR